MILTLGFVVIFYKTIYQDLLAFLLSLATIITGGGLKIMFSDPFSYYSMEAGEMERKRLPSGQ